MMVNPVLYIPVGLLIPLIDILPREQNGRSSVDMHAT